jgi:hypothetical protein
MDSDDENEPLLGTNETGPLLSDSTNNDESNTPDSIENQSNKPIILIINNINSIYPDPTSYERQLLEQVKLLYDNYDNDIFSNSDVIKALTKYSTTIFNLNTIIEYTLNPDYTNKHTLPGEIQIQDQKDISWYAENRVQLGEEAMTKYNREYLITLSTDTNDKLNAYPPEKSTEILRVLTQILDDYLYSEIIPYITYVNKKNNITPEAEPSSNEDKSKPASSVLNTMFTTTKDASIATFTQTLKSSNKLAGNMHAYAYSITDYTPYIGGFLIILGFILSSVLLSIMSKSSKKSNQDTPNTPDPITITIKDPVYIDKAINKAMLYKLIADNLNLVDIYNTKYDNIKVNYRKAYYESLNTTEIQEWTPRLNIFYTICYIILVCIFLYKSTDSWMKKIMTLLLILILTNAYVLKAIILFIIYVYNIISVRYLYNLK